MKYISSSLIAAVVFAVTVKAAPDSAPPDPSKLPPASMQTGVTFEKDIHPIMDQACVRCHGAQRPRAGLRLDTLDGVLKGSKDHQDVMPGQSDKSRLVFAVANIDGKVYMPPKPKARPNPPGANGATNAPAGPPPGASAHPWKPLTAEQVGLIRAWIDQGAK